MEDIRIGFIQGVAYSAGLVKRFGSNSREILEESGITEEELRKYCDDYDLLNLGLLIDEDK